MKSKFAHAILCLAVVAMLVGAANAATVGLWQFDEQAPGTVAPGTVGYMIDSSGNGHNGTLRLGQETDGLEPPSAVPVPTYYSNPPLVYTPEPGVPGNPPVSALHLNPGNFTEGEWYSDPLQLHDRVVVPHSTDFNMLLGPANLQSYTLEAIIKADSTPYEDTEGHETELGGAIITKRGPSGDGWCFRISNTGITGVTPGTLGMYIQAGWNIGGDFTNPDATGTINVCDDQWHQVAAVIQPNADPTLSSVTFYVDRVLDRTVLLTDVGYLKPWTNWDCANTYDVWIGDFKSRWNDQFVGDMDTVRFSTGALAPADMLQVPVPEPSSIVLLVVGAFALIAVRRVR